MSVFGGDSNGAGVSAGSVALLAGTGYNTNQKDGGAGGAVTIAAGTSHGGIYPGEKCTSLLQYFIVFTFCLHCRRASCNHCRRSCFLDRRFRQHCHGIQQCHVRGQLFC